MSDATMNDDKGLFWNSQNNDRLYDANSFGKWLSTFFTPGVFTGQCEVTVGSGGMEVKMAQGYVNIQNPMSVNPEGKVRLFEDETTFTLEMAHSVFPRIDTVVLERNDNNREIVAKIVKGVPADIPVPTPPERTSTIYQLVLAEIYVGAAVSAIQPSNITMKRADPTVCGIITGTVSNNQIMYGTEDMTPGESELADGIFYFVYE